MPASPSHAPRAIRHAYLTLASSACPRVRRDATVLQKVRQQPVALGGFLGARPNETLRPIGPITRRPAASPGQPALPITWPSIVIQTAAPSRPLPAVEYYCYYCYYYHYYRTCCPLPHAGSFNVWSHAPRQCSSTLQTVGGAPNHAAGHVTRLCRNLVLPAATADASPASTSPHCSAEITPQPTIIDTVFAVTSPPRRESHSRSQALTRVGPLTVMQRHHPTPAYLPPEIWQTIITAVDDHCFAWFVLRQVSPVLRSVTEDVFARYLLRTCSLRFAGQTLRDLL